MFTNSDVGRAIRRLRLDRRLSIEELAYEAGVTAGTLGKIERGDCNPRLRTLCSVADALGITLGQLVQAIEGH